MTIRTVPFTERHAAATPARLLKSDVPDPELIVIVGPNGQPARLPKSARCPHCGAGPDRRIVSGMGAVQDVTCEACGWEFEKERAL